MSPGQPDPAVVRRHLLAIDEALQVLRRHQGRPLADLTGTREELWAVERGLQLCAQNALDVAAHLGASAGRDVPDYATAIDRLVELGVLSPDLGGRFRPIAGFRNVLVHAYLDVDPATVHRLLNHHLDDFGEFARQVDAYFTRLQA
jgi:uncharacterized protein YutE (UPF0331/DUF86 family)